MADTGCGIPSEDLPYVFDRFYRARNTSGDNIQGAGLGLAISKRIIELHGGDIQAESVIDVGTALTSDYRSSNPRRIRNNVRRAARLESAGR